LRAESDEMKQKLNNKERALTVTEAKVLKRTVQPRGK
jgi:hypothetical protein